MAWAGIAFDEIPCIAASSWVQAGGDLVEHSNVRISDRERDRQPLLLSTGQPAVLRTQLVREVHSVNEFLRVDGFAIEGAVEVQCLTDDEIPGQFAFRQLRAE